MNYNDYYVAVASLHEDNPYGGPSKIVPGTKQKLRFYADEIKSSPYFEKYGYEEVIQDKISCLDGWRSHLTVDYVMHITL